MLAPGPRRPCPDFHVVITWGDIVVVWRQAPDIRISYLVKDLSIASAYTKLLRSNRHLFIRTICLLFGFAFFTAVGESFGSDILAANTLMIQLLMMAAYGMDGFAFAVEGLSGHRLGAGDLEGFYAAVRRCALWTMVAAVLVSLALLVAQEPLIRVLTSLDSVRVLMREYFPWLVALPLLAAPSYLLDGVFIGSAETRYMMTTMLLSLLGVYLPLWYVTSDWQNHGLWLAFSAFNFARGVTLYYCYRSLSARSAWPGPRSKA